MNTSALSGNKPAIAGAKWGFGQLAVLVLVGFLALPHHACSDDKKTMVDGVAVTKDEDTKARASIKMGLVMMGEDIENIPAELFQQLYLLEVRKMRSNPKYSELNEVAVELEDGWINPASTSSGSSRQKVTCRDCGAHFTVNPPGIINANPTECPNGGAHLPNWVSAGNGPDSSGVTCPHCGNKYRVNPPGIINSTPTDCPAGANHPPNWVPAR